MDGTVERYWAAKTLAASVDESLDGFIIWWHHREAGEWVLIREIICAYLKCIACPWPPTPSLAFWPPWSKQLPSPQSSAMRLLASLTSQLTVDKTSKIISQNEVSFLPSSISFKAFVMAMRSTSFCSVGGRISIDVTPLSSSSEIPKEIRKPQPVVFLVLFQGLTLSSRLDSDPQ